MTKVLEEGVGRCYVKKVFLKNLYQSLFVIKVADWSLQVY